MGEIRWMTYSELAEALGIGGDSARNLVRRKRWQRQTGNDGLARIGVPVEHLQEHAKSNDGEINPPTDAPTDGEVDEGVIQILNRHIERLEAEIENLKSERDVERVRAAQVEVLQAVLNLERKRFEDLHQDRDALRQERDRLLERVMAPPPKNGFLDRLRRAFG